jgi:hypothetical protein
MPVGNVTRQVKRLGVLGLALQNPLQGGRGIIQAAVMHVLNGSLNQLVNGHRSRGPASHMTS